MSVDSTSSTSYSSGASLNEIQYERASGVINFGSHTDVRYTDQRGDNLPELTDPNEPFYTKYVQWRSLFIVFELLILVSFCFSFSWVFMLPFCNFIFVCGCTWYWKGGLNKCNIHTPKIPHCPWCIASRLLNEIPLWGTPFLMIVFTVGLSFLWPRNRYWFYLFIPMSTWVLFNMLYAGIMKEYFHYPFYIIGNQTTTVIDIE